MTTPSFATGISATNGAADAATCDTGTLGTDTGPANLRANFTAENINLRWYNGNTRVNVPTASNSCTYDTPISLPANPTKPGYKFKGWKVITDYTPIEYIQATGTQYIDTGINPVTYNNFKWEIDFKFAESYDYDYSGLGTSNYYLLSGNSAGIWVKIDIKNSTTVGIQGAGIYTETKITTTPFARHVYKLQSDGVCSLDGQTYSLNYVSLPYNYYLPTIHLFNVNQPSFQSKQTTTGGYLYRSRMWNGTVLIQDMIPVKDLSGVACMYDRVTGQFFYNVGTGDFTAGPEI